MRELGMIGTTYRRGGQEGLQRFTLATPEDRLALLRACDVAQGVYVATCNRVEVVFLGRPGVSVATYRERMYRYFLHHPSGEAGDDALHRQHAARALHAYEGDGAAERLFLVTASLDSMNPGDAQVLGQVKAALREAQAQGCAGHGLGAVFEEAFTVAKKVRHQTRLGEGNTSMLSLAKQAMEARLPAQGGRVAVVGVGDMARQCAALLADHENLELIFVNRTLARAEALAQELQGQARELSDFLQAPGPIDVMVTATSAGQSLFDRAFFQALPAPSPLIIDLAVHHDVNPAAAQEAGVEVFDLDALQKLSARAKAAREKEMAAARIMVDSALESFRRRTVERDMAPVVRRLRESYEEAMRQELQSLLPRLPDVISPQLMEQWAQGVVNRLAHVPTVGLKQLAFEHGVAAAESFLQGMTSADDKPSTARKGNKGTP